MCFFRYFAIFLLPALVCDWSTESGQQIGVTVHLNWVKNFEDLWHAAICRRVMGWSGFGNYKLFLERPVFKNEVGPPPNLCCLEGIDVDFEVGVVEWLDVVVDVVDAVLDGQVDRSGRQLALHHYSVVRDIIIHQKRRSGVWKSLTDYFLTFKPVRSTCSIILISFYISRFFWLCFMAVKLISNKKRTWKYKRS